MQQDELYISLGTSYGTYEFNELSDTTVLYLIYF